MPAEANRPIPLTFNAHRIARNLLMFCIGAIVLFVVLDYQINYSRWTEIGALRRMFNTAREDGLASWFGITQTLLAGLTLWFIYLAVKHRPGARWQAVGWLILAPFFTYLAVDDGAQIHERLGSTFKAIQKDRGVSLDFFPSYTWQILFVPIFALLVLFALVFLWRELKTLNNRLVLLLALSCWGAAVVLDFFEGLDRRHPWNLYSFLAEHFELDAWAYEQFGRSAYKALRHFSKSFEEALEMLGMSLLWFLFIRHLAVAAADLRVRFLPGKSRTTTDEP
jgi:hypothetical protein